MELQFMESQGYGLTLFEPPANHEEIPFSATEEFKKEFLETWKEAYKAETEFGGNSGINIICVLQDLAKLLVEDKLKGDNFDEAYKVAAQHLLKSL